MLNPDGGLGDTVVTGFLSFRQDHVDGKSLFRVLEITAFPNTDCGPLVQCVSFFELDATGNCVDKSWRFVSPIEIEKQYGRDRVVRNARGSINQFLSILTILSCKNVSLQPHDNDPKQVRIAVKRHGGTPESYRYHTLVVRPPGAKSDAPAQDIGMMPRHVCRGRFSEYGPEFNKGLLFGKYSGRFYIPPHLKGDKKNGVVEKDYAIAPMLPGPTQ